MIRVLLFPDRRKIGNPYLDLLTDAVEGVKFTDWSVRGVLAKSEVLHVHWPDTVWQDGSAVRRLARGVAFVSVLGLARIRGTKIVETVHNVLAHDAEPDRVSDVLRWAVSSLLNGVQVLDQSSLARLDARRRRLPSSVVPHGHYAGSYPPVKRQAGPPFGIFHVGFLRPYKGTEELISVFSALARHDWRLHIAGQLDDGPRATLLRELAASTHTELTTRFLDPAEVSQLAECSHLCVIPFRHVENSGSVLLALSLGIPVLAPDIGNLSAIRDLVGDDWVRLYEPPLTEKVLAEAMADSERRDWADEPDMQPLSWEAIRRNLADAYQAIL